MKEMLEERKEQKRKEKGTSERIFKNEKEDIYGINMVKV